MLKKLALVVSASALSLLLFITASLWILNQTLLKPTQIKKWVKDSGLYTNIIPAVAEVIETPSTESTVPFKDPAIIEAGKTAFNDKVLQTATEQIIDQVTYWLEGRGDNLDLKIDISEARVSFAQGIGNIAASRLAALPVCSAKAVPSFDAFNITCLPKGVSPAVQGDRITKELIATKAFLGDGVITNETIGLTNQNQKALSFAPSVYKSKNVSFYILVLLVFALTLIVIFCSTKRRGGIKKVAGVYIFISVALLSTAVLLPYLTKALAPATNSTSDKAFVDKIVMPLINQVKNSLITQHILTGAIIGGVGLILTIVVWLTKSGKQSTGEPPAEGRAFSDAAGSGVASEPVEPTEQSTDTKIQNIN